MPHTHSLSVVSPGDDFFPYASSPSRPPPLPGPCPPSSLLRSVNTVFQRNVGLPDLHCSSLGSAWPRCAPAAPSPFRAPSLHSTLAIFSPRLTLLLLLVSPLLLSFLLLFFFLPPFFSSPVLVPHHHHLLHHHHPSLFFLSPCSLLSSSLLPTPPPPPHYLLSLLAPTCAVYFSVISQDSSESLFHHLLFLLYVWFPSLI